MQAVYYEKHGGIDMMKIGPLPKPIVTKDSVIVEVKGAGINPIDYKVR